MESQCLSHLIKIMVLWIPYPSQVQICLTKQWNINIFDFNIPASPSIHRPSRIQIKLKMRQIGIGCSRTKKCSQSIQSTEIPLEIPLELSLFVITYLLAYVVKYVITYATTYVVAYAISQAITYVMTYVHPNCKSISSAKPHPQPPYQASAWSYRYKKNDKDFHYCWITPCMWRSTFCLRFPI